ncbi:MAG: hypothetical protein F6K41_01230 [Symploca sp. SIO3E6]|nr:hypothetical protein [Caldora sp. SIO3E6]
MTETKEIVDRYEEAVALLEKTHRELEAKIDEVEQLKTAIHIANGWYQLCNVKLPGTEHNLKSYFQEQIDNLFVGTVSAFAMKTPPDGWLECNGGEISRTNYYKLFQRVGVTFGSGDGSTTFNLPDLRGLVIRGWDNGGKYDSDRKFGSYQADQIQSHTHRDSGHSHTGETDDAGNHDHDGSVAESGSHCHSGSTDYAGRHKHSIDVNETGDWWISCFKRGGTSFHYGDSKDYSGSKYMGWKAPLDFDGRHYHNLNINHSGSHSHDLSINSAGEHSHTVSTNTAYASLGSPVSFGNSEINCGSETRTKNLALMYCIFAGK